METSTNCNYKDYPKIIKLDRCYENHGSLHTASPNQAGRFEPEPWATSDEGFGEDIINMYLQPAVEIKHGDTLAPSDDAGLHLKRFSSISKMLN